jgi:hypothetical protein
MNVYTHRSGSCRSPPTAQLYHIEPARLAPVLSSLAQDHLFLTPSHQPPGLSPLSAHMVTVSSMITESADAPQLLDTIWEKQQIKVSNVILIGAFVWLL